MMRIICLVFMLLPALESMEDKVLGESVIASAIIKTDACEAGSCLKKDDIAEKAVQDGKLHDNELKRVIIFQPFGPGPSEYFPSIRLR